MTSIAKLKDRARRHEQQEDWKAAIEAYQRVLEAEEGADELELELGLYNRIGDLFLRIGQTDQAVSYYERAADKYAEAGFFNNAIALCNKALRHRPGRPDTYLKLSRLCLEQGFLTDARRWILSYAERQVNLGKTDDALAELADFADRSDDPDVRQLLARHLAGHDRREEALDQLRRAYASLAHSGVAGAAAEVADLARELDPSADLDAYVDGEGLAPLDDGGEPSPTGVGPAGEGVEADPDEPERVDGLESTAVADSAATAAAEADTVGGLETFEEEAAAELEDGEPEPEPEEPGAELEDEELEPLPLLDAELDEEIGDELEPLPLLDSGYDDDVEDEGSVAAPELAAPAEAVEPSMEEHEEPEGSLEVDELDVERVEEAGEPEVSWELKTPGSPLEPEAPAALEPGDFDLEEPEPEKPEPEEPEPEEPEAPEPPAAAAEEVGPAPVGRVEEADPASVLQRARDRIDRSDLDGAVRELGRLATTHAGPGVFREGVSVATAIVERDANHIGGLQRRVELAARVGDRTLLVGAYLDLADTLARLGAETKAQAMYERVLSLDPDNAAALEALGRADPEPVPAQQPADLTSALEEVELEPEGHGTRAGESAVAEPAADGDPAFAAMLSQFREKATEQAKSGSAADHYDLGLAFKEMGLIDEAIGEFQAALSAGEERLKVYEELGRCFMLKDQYNVALKVLTRALKVPHRDETELIGVHYLLGTCYEKLGHRMEARQAYERVLAMDDSFEDVPERLTRL